MVLKVKAEKKVVKRREVEEGVRCMARIWVEGKGGQCSRKRVETEEYCSCHRKNALETTEAGCFDEAGKPRGLFFGRVDGEMPIYDSEGNIAVVWQTAEIKKVIAEALAAGKTYNKNTAEGKKALGIKPTPKVKVVVEGVEVKAKVVKAKVVGEKVVKAKKAKVPNVLKKPMPSFIYYSAINRAEQARLNPNLNPHDIQRLLASIWNRLDDCDKQFYIQETIRLRQEYKEKINNLNKNVEPTLQEDLFKEYNSDDDNVLELNYYDTSDASDNNVLGLNYYDTSDASDNNVLGLNYYDTTDVSDGNNSSNDKIKIQSTEILINRKNIPLVTRRLVWNKYIGEDIGKYKCYCCKSTDITQLSFHCGHVISKKKGGKDVVKNLRPICQSCNSSMRTTNMYDFINYYT
jgi:hypothetical protein